MMRIGTIWDRTTEVIGGRLSILTAIAALLLLVPAVAQAALVYLGPGPGAQGIRAIVQIGASIVTLWGVLALTAVASDPAVTRSDATAIGLRRLPPAIGLVAIAVAVLMVASLPGGMLLVSSGFDFTRAAAGQQQAGVDLATAGAAGLYFLTLMIVMLWLSARFVPLMAIVVNERRGFGAFGRSFALTRGATLKLIGVLILYGIVLLVAMTAATSVVGLVARLILGAEGLASAAFLAGVAGAVVTAGFSVLQCAFSAQYYVAARDAADRA